MNIDVVSPLRQRMIEDMTARKLSAGTQRLHISSCKRLAVFLQRSLDTTTVEDNHLLVSAGRASQNASETNLYSWYLGYQITGP